MTHVLFISCKRESWALLKQLRFRTSIAVPFHSNLEVPSRKRETMWWEKKKLDRTIKKSYGFRWGSGCDINRYN